MGRVPRLPFLFSAPLYLMPMPRIVISSGYYSPLHAGHVECLERAKELAGPGGVHIAIVNNDLQQQLKRGYVFMEEKDRIAVVGALRCVDKAVGAIDQDRTVRATIEMLAADPATRPTHYAKGGDAFAGDIPEAPTCAKLGIQIIDGLGDKIQSSSWIVARAPAPAPAP